MRISLVFLAALHLGAGPALAWSAADVERVVRSGAGDMGRLIVHQRPRGPYAAEFAGPSGTVDFESFRGRIVVVSFWSIACPSCLSQLPSLDALARRMGRRDLVVVAISTDSVPVERLRRWFEANGIGALSVYQDRTGSVAREVALLGQPTTLLLDRSGREVARFIGPTHWNAPEAVRVIEVIRDVTSPPSD